MLPPSSRRFPRAACALFLAAAVLRCGYEDGPLNPLAGKEPVTAAALGALAVDGLTDSVVRLATTAEVKAGRAVPRSYIVMFRSAAPKVNYASYLDEYRRYYGLITDGTLADPRIQSIDYIDQVNLGTPGRPLYDEADFVTPPALRFAFSARDRVEPIMGTLAEVRFATLPAAEQVLGEWEKKGLIWFAEPNYESRLEGTFADLKTAYSSENIWWHKAIKLYEAFDAMEVRKVPPHPSDNDLFAPVVAVMDSGLDIDHEAIKDQLWVNTLPGQSGCAGDVNGCDVTKVSKGVFGDGVVYPFRYDVGARTCPPQEDADGYKNCTHGTHVAGIIAAKVGNRWGGVCPLCKIMPVKIIGPSESDPKKGGAQTKWQLAGMKYITKFVRNNKSLVRVINSSFGDYVRSRAMTVLISVLSEAPHNILVVGAAGNEDSMKRLYPAANERAIAVSALDPLLRKASYSNFGPWVDIAAPGGIGTGGDGTDSQKIYSLAPGGGGGSKVGTSMACPVVAGVAGLVLTVDPERSFNELRNSIIYGADPSIYSGDVGNGYNRRYYYPQPEGDSVRRPLLGAGVVDAKCAVESCRQAEGYVPPAISRVDQGCSVVGAGGEGYGGLLVLQGALVLVVAIFRRQGARRRASC